MSDVPEGYKMSEVGVIPEEWEVKSLDSVGLFRKGKNIPKKDLTSEGVPCVLYGEIYTKYNFTSKKLNSFIHHAIAQQSTSINKGDILFAGSGETAEEIGKCFTYLSDEKACAGGDINILSPFNDDSTFLGYLLNSPQVNKQKSNLGQGSSVVHIYSSSLKTILIPTPPLPEQQAIASTLSDVDALITALEQLITKKRNIKQGAMQQLITGKKRLPGFSGEWEVKAIGKEIDLLTGFPFPSSQYSSSGIKLLRGSNIKRGVTDWSDDITAFWEEITPDLKNYTLNEGDIVIAMDGSLVGRSFAILSKKDLPALLLQRVARIRSNKINVGYLKEFICSDYFSKYCDSVKTVTAIPHISPDDIRNFTILLPPSKEEQQAIAKILSDMDTEIESLEQKRDKYKVIKQGMMQELLTGKRRFA